MSTNRWVQEYLAGKSHDCDECHREIRPAEYYLRRAQLNKGLPTYEGEVPPVLDPAVIVRRLCKEHY